MRCPRCGKKMKTLSTGVSFCPDMLCGYQTKSSSRGMSSGGGPRGGNSLGFAQICFIIFLIVCALSFFS